ncbi:MAG: hypothetical protein ABJG88_03580, partial [Litorimonas sp.]
MFNTRLVREEDALLHSDILTLLMQKHGPIQRPKVPSPLHKSGRLYHTAWTEADTRTTVDWAYDTFHSLLCECGMEGWPVTIFPLEAQGIREILNN